MKRILIIPAIMFSVYILQAQQTQPLFVSNPYPKTITVSGSAEMEVIPDEIYVNVDLKEYQKKGEAKKDLETIKTQFLEACKTAGIADSAVSIVSYSGFNNYYYWKRQKKSPDLFASIVYQVKFRRSELMDKLVEKLDDEATQNFTIVSTSHSRMTEFRKQLKIQAVKAAKDKGIYLTEAIGEKLGDAITINEPGQPNIIFGNPGANENIRIRGMNSLNDNLRFDVADNYKVQEVDFKKIKLRFEVEVVFSLK